MSPNNSKRNQQQLKNDPIIEYSDSEFDFLSKPRMAKKKRPRPWYEPLSLISNKTNKSQRRVKQTLAATKQVQTPTLTKSTTQSLRSHVTTTVVRHPTASMGGPKPTYAKVVAPNAYVVYQNTDARQFVVISSGNAEEIAARQKYFVANKKTTFHGEDALTVYCSNLCEQGYKLYGMPINNDGEDSASNPFDRPTSAFPATTSSPNNTQGAQSMTTSSRITNPYAKKHSNGSISNRVASRKLDAGIKLPAKKQKVPSQTGPQKLPAAKEKSRVDSSNTTAVTKASRRRRSSDLPSVEVAHGVPAKKQKVPSETGPQAPPDTTKASPRRRSPRLPSVKQPGKNPGASSGTHVSTVTRNDNDSRAVCNSNNAQHGQGEEEEQFSPEEKKRLLERIGEDQVLAFADPYQNENDALRRNNDDGPPTELSDRENNKSYGELLWSRIFRDVPPLCRMDDVVASYGTQVNFINHHGERCGDYCGIRDELKTVIHRFNFVQCGVRKAHNKTLTREEDRASFNTDDQKEILDVEEYYQPQPLPEGCEEAIRSQISGLDDVELVVAMRLHPDTENAMNFNAWNRWVHNGKVENGRKVLVVKDEDTNEFFCEEMKSGDLVSMYPRINGSENRRLVHFVVVTIGTKIHATVFDMCRRPNAKVLSPEEELKVITQMVDQFRASVDALGDGHEDSLASFVRTIDQRLSSLPKPVFQKQRLLKSVSADVLEEKLQQDWLVLCRLLQAYKDKHGDCLVPHGQVFDGVNLGSWVSNQRYLARQDKLVPERRETLDNMEFVWNVQDDSWNYKLSLLKAYKDKHGDCLVPYDHVVDGVNLGKWVCDQRYYAKHNYTSITPDRYARLDSLGFFSMGTSTTAKKLKDDVKWDRHFLLLKAYKAKHGNCRVPQKRKVDGVALGNWVDNQCKAGKKGTLQQYRREKLDELGFFRPRGQAKLDAYVKVV